MRDWDPFDWAMFMIFCGMAAWLIFMLVFYAVYA